MKQSFFILLLTISTFISRAQQKELDLVKLTGGEEIQLADLTKEKIYTDIWDWKLDNKELNKVYIDKINWGYQPTSEHPYTAIAYRMEFFKKETRGIINYQIIVQTEDNFDQASYCWVSDSTANVYLCNSITGNSSGAVLKQSQMGGGIPIDYLGNQKTVKKN